MNEEWYYSNQGQQIGPIGIDALRQLSASGQLKPSDLVWHEGMSDWVEAGNVDGLFAVSVAGQSVPRPSIGAPADHAVGYSPQAAQGQRAQSQRTVGTSTLPTFQQVRNSGAKKFFMIFGAIILGPVALFLVFVVIVAIVHPSTKARLDQDAANAITSAAHDAGASNGDSTNSNPVDAALPIYSVTQIAQSYNDNGLAADAQFNGKRIKVTGAVNDIDSDIMNNPTISMEDGDLISPVFTFDSDSKDQLAQLKKGMQVTLACTGASDVMKVPQFDDCELAK